MARTGAADPATSQEAADGVERSGLAQAHRRLCLDAVRAEPGLTSAELAVALGTRGFPLSRFQVARRLPELLAAGDSPGHLIQGELRKCNVTRKRCVTWWPLNVGPAAPTSDAAKGAPPAPAPVRNLAPAAPRLF
jgi:hypothetical protein